MNNTQEYINEQCDKKDIIPLDQIKNKAKAYNNFIKSDDPKFFANLANETQTLTIDRDLPKSDAEVKRIELEEKYQLWKDLFLKSSSEKSLPDVFIQMQMLEKDLKANKYKPYLNDKHLSENTEIDDKLFLSFVFSYYFNILMSKLILNFFYVFLNKKYFKK